jgi:16S rRNA (guanine966-N2)-methyltransferase
MVPASSARLALPGTVPDMRVVAGSAKGRRLVVPPGRAVRPTADRIREAIFNALGSLDAVRDAVVLDLFAGTGALGIEALSRGADHAVLVDRDHAAQECIRANLSTTGFTDRARVVRSDAESFAGQPSEPFDLVLLDPPYDYARWPELLASLEPALGSEAVVVVEADRAVELPAGWVVEREKRYGGTFVAIVRPPETRTHRREHR